MDKAIIPTIILILVFLYVEQEKLILTLKCNEIYHGGSYPEAGCYEDHEYIICGMDGTSEIYRDSRLVFQGEIYCNYTCGLYGKFY